jgi:hypothetical protein
MYVFDVPGLEYATESLYVSLSICDAGVLKDAYTSSKIHDVDNNKMRAILFSCFRLSTFG